MNYCIYLCICVGHTNLYDRIKSYTAGYIKGFIEKFLEIVKTVGKKINANKAKIVNICA